MAIKRKILRFVNYALGREHLPITAKGRANHYYSCMEAYNKSAEEKEALVRGAEHPELNPFNRVSITFNNSNTIKTYRSLAVYYRNQADRCMRLYTRYTKMDSRGDNSPDSKSGLVKRMVIASL